MIALLLALACTQSDAEIRQYLSQRAAALERDFFPGVKSGADFEQLRARGRDEYLYMLGLSPLPEKTPLKPVITGRLEFDAVGHYARPDIFRLVVDETSRSPVEFQATRATAPVPTANPEE